MNTRSDARYVWILGWWYLAIGITVTAALTPSMGALYPSVAGIGLVALGLGQFHAIHRYRIREVQYWTGMREYFESLCLAVDDDPFEGEFDDERDSDYGIVRGLE